MPKKKPTLSDMTVEELFQMAEKDRRMLAMYKDERSPLAQRCKSEAQRYAIIRRLTTEINEAEEERQSRMGVRVAKLLNIASSYCKLCHAAIRTDRDYHIAIPNDGLLYVEVPTGDQLVNLLLNSQFRREAHFRTNKGYVPYSGGGIAFKLLPLVMHGVKPIWYASGETQTAVNQLIEDGIYDDEFEARQHHLPKQYAKECEWQGPYEMRLDPAWIDFAWYNPRKPPSEESMKALQEVLPNLDLRLEPPEIGS